MLASVVALDQPFDYNRLGATNPAGMTVFALRHDVVLKSDTGGYDAGTPVTLTENLTGAQLAGNVALRADKRPRPLALRMTVGQCLEIAFQNLLGTTPADGEQPADRNVGMHVKGLAVVNGVQMTARSSGRTPAASRRPGRRRPTPSTASTRTGTCSTTARPWPRRGGGGTTAYGLFGAVNVEPESTQGFRSQLTRIEMDLAALPARNPDGSASPGNEPQYGDDGLPLSRSPTTASRFSTTRRSTRPTTRPSATTRPGPASRSCASTTTTASWSTATSTR